MQVGLHSFSRREAFKHEPGYDAARFIAEAAGWGFEAVEIMTGKAGSLDHIASEDEPSLRDLATRAAAAGCPIRCWSTYNDFSFTPNEAWRQDNIAYIERWIPLAAATGVPNLRFLTGYLPQDEDPAAMEALVVEATRRCAALAEEHGVNLALENHSVVFLYAEDIARLRTAVPSPRLTTCPDPTNGFKPDELDDAGRERLYANLAALAPHATNAHLKIHGTPAAPFPHFDLDRVIGILAQAGYRGAIMLELAAIGQPVDILPAAREQVAAAIGRAGVTA